MKKNLKESYLDESTQTNFNIKYFSANELKSVFISMMDNFKDDTFAFIDSLNNNQQIEVSGAGDVYTDGNWMA